MTAIFKCNQCKKEQEARLNYLGDPIKPENWYYEHIIRWAEKDTIKDKPEFETGVHFCCWKCRENWLEKNKN